MDIFDPASEAGKKNGEGTEKPEEMEKSDRRNYNMSSKILKKSHVDKTELKSGDDWKEMAFSDTFADFSYVSFSLYHNI